MVSLYGLKAIFGWEGCFPEEEKKEGWTAQNMLQERASLLTSW